MSIKSAASTGEVTLTVGSLFAGIGGFDLGLERAGMQTAWQVEIEPFCQKVLAARFPNAERFDDVVQCGARNLKRVDVVCGGSPCQGFSVAGKRGGLDDERSGLFREYARILRELRPAWFVFENVPGLLSQNGGRDFAEVLRIFMVECGYGISWRVLNSQFFGVAQRRRRLFVVGYFGRPCPASILFEPEGRSGDSQACSETWADIAAPLTRGSGVTGNAPGRRREDDTNIVRVHPTLTTRDSKGVREDVSEPGYVVGTLNSGGSGGGFRTEPGEHLTFGWNRSPRNTMQVRSDVTDPLRGNESSNPAIAYALRSDPGGTGQGHNTSYVCGPLGGAARSGGFSPNCEQAADGQLHVSAAPHAGGMRDSSRLPEGMDSARYRALGNAVTVNVAEWIGNRILEFERGL